MTKPRTIVLLLLLATLALVLSTRSPKDHWPMSAIARYEPEATFEPAIEHLSDMGDGLRVVWTMGRRPSDTELNLFMFVLDDAKVLDEVRFEAPFVTEERPLNWVHSGNGSPPYSITSGIYDPALIDAVAIQGVAPDLIESFLLPDGNVFFYSFAPVEMPYQITGYRQGTIAFRNYPIEDIPLAAAK